jgi:predicted glycoside hydrolase/deacetylase ChbG (UPF0249 family)
VHSPQPASRRLIINADDFGLTPGVNRAILELNAADVLPSATLMATAPAFREAVHGAFTQPSLGVGCHIVLMDGTPALHAVDLPTLAPGGRFRSGLGSFVRALFTGRISAGEIEREAVAQIRRLQQAGITVTHLDTHKHTHMFARVLIPLLRAAKICGVGAIRNPFEPEWSRRLCGTAPTGRRLQVRALTLMRGGFLRAVERAGVSTTDGSIGVLATGTLDANTLFKLLVRMPPGTWELVCHPGYADPALQKAGTRLVESRETERSALLSTLERPSASLPRMDLINYGELTA